MKVKKERYTLITAIISMITALLSLLTALMALLKD